MLDGRRGLPRLARFGDYVDLRSAVALSPDGSKLVGGRLECATQCSDNHFVDLYDTTVPGGDPVAIPRGCERRE